MYTLFLTTVLILTLSMSFFIEVTHISLKKKSVGELGVLNSTTHKIKYLEDTSNHSRIPQKSKNAFIDKELIEKTLLRTCNHIYQKGVYNKCPNARKVNTVWGFAGSVGTKGSLNPAWSGSVVSTFTCGNEAPYGRYLIQKALPKSLITEKGFGYDFRDIVNNGYYPCGHDGIVY